MELSFDQVLSVAVTPLVLISGVGLILLSLVNRYSHAIDRTRQLYGSIDQDQSAKTNRKRQVDQMYKRCQILRKSIGYLVFSVACSGVLILISVFQLFIPYALDVLQIALLFVAISTLLISILLFFKDIRLSMTALDIELGKDSEQ